MLTQYISLGVSQDKKTSLDNSVIDGASGAYCFLVPMLPYTGHIHGIGIHMGGKCDFALCLEIISIYKIPLTVYSRGNFTANALLFHTSLFTNTCQQNTFWSIYLPVSPLYS